jgi:uncharacterized membrane protein
MSRRVLLITLFISLALNVFVVGAFVGAALLGGRFQGSPRQDLRPRSPVAVAVRTLPPAAQATWRAQMPDYLATYGPKVREARKLYRDTVRGFGQQPFDDAAAFADLKRARGLEYESRVEMDRRLVAFAATLPQAQRANFGEALGRPRAGLGGRRPGDGARPALSDR